MPESKIIVNSVESQERLFVSLTLIGKDLIPDEITSSLGINPDYSFRRGDSHQNDHGKMIVRRHGLWEINSDGKKLPSGNIVAQLNWLVDLIEPVRENLSQILENKTIQARASCFWIVPDGRINVEVEPELLSQLASLNMKFWFDIYSDKS